MISMMFFLLLLGLIVFGPKKTIEMAQSVGRSVAELKKSVAAIELGSITNPDAEVSRRIDAVLAQQSLPVDPPR
jgi:Sec-independent protein translocase protein TatA